MPKSCSFKTLAVLRITVLRWLQDPRTNVLARAPQVLPAAKKSIRARSWSKTERTLETSLASLVLQASESRAQTWMTKPRELHLDGRKLPIAAELPAFVAPSPTKHAESVPQLKVAPLLRRRNSGATPWTGAFADFVGRLLCEGAAIGLSAVLHCLECFLVFVACL